MPIVEKVDQCQTDEKVVEIEVERLQSFSNHPFKVQADSQMIELQDSIKKYGILNPLIVRPTQLSKYNSVQCNFNIKWCIATKDSISKSIIIRKETG